ncbi:TonB-dependent receptor domain-containing protein [Colwellia sp. RSH04]|uniref:TonB-dependent receptor domain-containing protein n=1 Tax=Colwellia sp. RSH04 TaxID=2305464 RepID=UPI0015FDB528|nr:TonB-dependent receptor [Colwellia sp. RSH04]
MSCGSSPKHERLTVDSFALRHLDDHFSVFANAAYQDGENDDTGEYLNSITLLSGIAGISFEQASLSTELIVNWTDRMDKINEGNLEIAGYGTIDLLATYVFTDNLTVNLALTNLADKEYVQYLNGSNHKDVSTLNDVIDPGRSFSATVRYAF